MTASIGDRLRLKQQLPYLKTADPMPMLRPSDLVSLDEVGEVVALHPLDTVAVRFRRGTYLISLDQLEAAATGDDAQDDVAQKMSLKMMSMTQWSDRVMDVV
jgi:hypothetical protein